MTFLECVRECANTPEFVSHWLRLRGITLPSTPLERLIDDATGHHDDIARQFIADVNDLVWSRLSHGKDTRC